MSWESYLCNSRVSYRVPSDEAHSIEQLFNRMRWLGCMLCCVVLQGRYWLEDKPWWLANDMTKMFENPNQCTVLIRFYWFTGSDCTRSPKEDDWILEKIWLNSSVWDVLAFETFPVLCRFYLWLHDFFHGIRYRVVATKKRDSGRTNWSELNIILDVQWRPTSMLLTFWQPPSWTSHVTHSFISQVIIQWSS